MPEHPLVALIGREPAVKSFAPIELVCGHTGRPAISHGFVAPSLVTDGVTEDPAREDDDVIGAHAKVGVPALSLNQGISQDGAEVVGGIIRTLDVKQRPDARLVRRRLPGDILPIDARYPQVADPHVTSDAKALGDNSSLQHDAMLAPGSDNLSTSYGVTSAQHKTKCSVMHENLAGGDQPALGRLGADHAR